MLVIGILIGLVVGAAVAAAWWSRREAVLRARLQAAEREVEVVHATREQFSAEFRAISGEALGPAVEQLVKLSTEQRRADAAEMKRMVDPVLESSRRVADGVQKIERQRSRADGELTQMLRGLSEGVTGLRSETGNLVSALRRPQTRGSWGEMQLRRAVEMAGMLEHCDFVEQQTVDGADGRLRPDLVVRLPGERVIVVDSKVPLDAYLSATETDDEAQRAGHLRRHARQVRDHVTKLAAKNYAREFASPEMVVMFIPNEGMHHAALQEDATLLEFGTEQHVLIATPTTLIALLQAAYYGWRQEHIAESARDIADAGRELHQRVGVFLSAFHKVGRGLASATEAFNSAVGSMEARVLPSLRRMADAGADSGRELQSPSPIDSTPRLINAPELVLSVDDEIAELVAKPSGQIIVRAVPDEPA